MLGYDDATLGGPVELVSGRLPEGPGEVVINDVDDAFGFAVGDVVAVQPSGLELTIVGSAADVGRNGLPTLFPTTDTGVLKAISVRDRTLLVGVMGQAVVLTLVGLVVAIPLAALFDVVVPPDAIPFALDPARVAVSSALLLTAPVLGAAFTLRQRTPAISAPTDYVADAKASGRSGSGYFAGRPMGPLAT